MSTNSTTSSARIVLPASSLAVQMYTVREFTRTEADLADTLAKIARMGYPAVQLSAVAAMEGGNSQPLVSTARARQLLDDNGLACIATHRSWTELRDRTEETIAFHQTLGCDFVAIGMLPEEYRNSSAEGYRRFIQEAAPVIARLKAAGIRFGYHNHDLEFARVDEAEPQTLWDIFVDEGGADFYLELDLYWAWHAGVNPAVLLNRIPGRAPVIHLKDKGFVAGAGVVMAAVGEGNMPWEMLLPACQEAGVVWYAVEQDICRRDPFDCLASSFRYLTGVQ